MLVAVLLWSLPAATDTLPFGVGAVTITLPAPAGSDRPLVTEIWYPTNSGAPPAVHHYPSGVDSQAARNAPLAAGRFPLILFSHGFSAVREQSTFLTEHLAQHGYIVAAPDHPKDGARDFQPWRAAAASLDRPNDLQRVLEHVLGPKAPMGVNASIDPTRIGAMGHSLGGATVLALAGAPIRMKGLKLDPPATVDYRDVSDRRIRAIVLLAPLSEPAFDAFSLDHVRTPVLMFAGDRDQVTPIAKHQQPIFDHLRSSCTFVTIVGATHFNFNNESMLAGAVLPIRLLHRPAVDRAACDRLIQRMTLEFFDRQRCGREVANP